MLLYIGNQEEYHCLQELSDKLQQPICIIPAPEDPMEILACANTQYSYYIVNIGSYREKQKELITVLKQLLQCIEGKLILLAVNMTTETPMIMELMYAGFTNIIFGRTTPDLSSGPGKQRIVNEAPIPISLRATEPFSGSAIAMEQRPTEPMKDKNSFCGEMGGRDNPAITSDCKGASKRRSSNKRLLAGGAGILAFIIVLVVVYKVVITKQEDYMTNKEELILAGNGQQTEEYLAPAVDSVMEGMSKYLNKPEASVGTPLPSTPPAVAKETINPKELVEPENTVKPEELKEPENVLEPEQIKEPQKVVEPEEIKEPQKVVESEKPKESVKSKVPKKASSVEKSNNNSVSIRSISLPSSIRMVTGGSVYIEPECKPANAKRISLHWSSSNSKIATVRNGTIRALKPGVVYIMVETKSGKKAECKVVIADQ